VLRDFLLSGEGLSSSRRTASTDLEDDKGILLIEFVGVLMEFGLSFVLGVGVSGGGGVKGGFSFNGGLKFLEVGDSSSDGNKFMSSKVGLFLESASGEVIGVVSFSIPSNVFTPIFLL